MEIIKRRFITLSEPKKVSLIESELNSRYNIKQLKISYGGKNKMKKTFLDSIEQLAKDIDIPAKIIFMFLKPECNEVIKDGIYYYSGYLELELLESKFLNMINILLFCSNRCNVPEVIYSCENLTKKLKRTCKSCGEVVGFKSDDFYWVKPFKNELIFQKESKFW